MKSQNACTLETPNLELARQHMRLGEHSLAIVRLLEDREFYPNNLFIISYLAACYYMTADYVNFKKLTLDLFTEFEKNKKNLSENEFDKMTLSLVKLLEEIGEVQQAIRLLKCYTTESIDLKSLTKSKILAQKLRLLSCYESGADLSHLYQFSGQKASQKDSCYIDHECALMLADSYLFGLSNARARLDRFLKSNSGNHAHKRFLVFDFI